MILVTGASGFIGRYLIDRAILDGREVLATAKNDKYIEYFRKLNIPFTSLDVTQESDFNKMRIDDIDAVVHLAGLLSIDASKWTALDYLKVNAIGTYNVLEYCRKNDIRKIVYAMTHSDVNRSNELIIGEETPRKFGGAIPYIVSKISAMNYIDAYSQDHGIQGISLRFPGIRGYSSRDTCYNCVFHQFIQKAIDSKPIEIWGEHKTIRDLVYIKDVIGAIMKTIDSGDAKGLYNIGSGKGLTIEDEAKAIIKVFSPWERPSQLIYRPDIKEVRKRSYIFNVSKARNDFGYEPKYSYESGLEDYKVEMNSGRFDIFKDKFCQE